MMNYAIEFASCLTIALGLTPRFYAGRSVIRPRLSFCVTLCDAVSSGLYNDKLCMRGNNHKCVQ